MQAIPAISLTAGVPTQAFALSFVMFFDGVLTAQEVSGTTRIVAVLSFSFAHRASFGNGAMRSRGVVVVGAQDYKRHCADARANGRWTHVLDSEAGDFVRRQWKDVVVVRLLTE